MQIAQTISFKRAAKGARRITANFATATDLADMILVQGTEDFRRVNKDQKTWMTRCRYSTLELTLQYIDFTAGGIVIQAVSYNAQGQIIQTPTQDAQIINPSAVVDGNTLEVTIGFTSTVEIGLSNFNITKEIKGIGDLGSINTFAGTGPGSNYSIVDGLGDRGTITYSVFAVFPNTPTSSLGKLCGTIEDVEV